MSSAAYLPLTGCATAQQQSPIKPFLISLFIAGLLLSGCAGKKEVAQPAVPTAPAPTEQAATVFSHAPELSYEIGSLLQQARSSGEPEAVIDQLDGIAMTAAKPLAEEALFRKSELMLEFLIPGAATQTLALLAEYPNHALAPYAMVWLAEWHAVNNQHDIALQFLTEAVHHPRLTRELLNRIAEDGKPLLAQASEGTAVQWLLAMADTDEGKEDIWLRQAAGVASLITLENMIRNLEVDRYATLFLQAARLHLMAGQNEDVRNLSALLSLYAPSSDVTKKVKVWASGQIQNITLGILLPLSGKYAHFGRNALKGIRLALKEHGYETSVALEIRDTAQGPQACVAGYHTLVTSGADWIIGPLLHENTQALAPYLQDNIPVISLTQQSNLALESPALFVHSVSREVQAYWLAELAWQQGARKFAVLAGSSPSERDETEAFKQHFTQLGGEIIGDISLNDQSIDHRDELQDFRAMTDDETLLASLDEELQLFIPARDLEIRLPANFDGLYLATTGQQVASLAGQMAYTGIRNVLLLGSNRWDDGHLLDDKGRYLDSAYFVRFPDPNNSSIRKTFSSSREIWGQEVNGALFLTAYDTTVIAAVVSSRLSLNGRDAIRALKDTEGFPALTGFVRFDETGAGHKQFPVFVIRNDEIVAGS